MPYDQRLAVRVRRRFNTRRDVEEKRMFGGLAFMLRGHMACGIVGSTLMVRVGPTAYEDALDEPHAREMDFTGKPIRGMVYVDPPGLEGRARLDRWIGRAVTFVESLPPKKKSAARRR